MSWLIQTYILINGAILNKNYLEIDLKNFILNLLCIFQFLQSNFF
jgi:hypothetical protein